MSGGFKSKLAPIKALAYMIWEVRKRSGNLKGHSVTLAKSKLPDISTFHSVMVQMKILLNKLEDVAGEESVKALEMILVEELIKQCYVSDCIDIRDVARLNKRSKLSTELTWEEE
uniref:Uncharacterized protein n=1 Tax=Guillardia theta TaxID=55529 RepID=A0A6U6BHA9_GUITH